MVKSFSIRIFKAEPHHAYHPNRRLAGHNPDSNPQTTGSDPAAAGLAAGVSTRFIVNLESGKPMVRLEHVLHVIGALGG